MVTDIIKRMEDFMNEMEGKWGAMDKEFDKVQNFRRISQKGSKQLYTPLRTHFLCKSKSKLKNGRIMCRNNWKDSLLKYQDLFKEESPASKKSISNLFE
ncbi:hypothetical protein ASG99_08700 [Bacillus sp. Soil768D1]|nr:hypothetical protein ASG99_08700 [Bacillus sp. Soil768D1]